MRNIFLNFITISIITTCILLLLFGCATNPVTGKAQLPHVPEEVGAVAPAEEKYSKKLKDSDDVIWIPILEAAEVQAGHDNKPLFIYFYGSNWCGDHCEYMDNVIFKDQRVIDHLNENFVSVKVDITVDMQTQQSYVNKYKLQAIPAYYFQRPNGERITQAYGRIVTAEEFIRGLNFVLSQ